MPVLPQMPPQLTLPSGRQVPLHMRRSRSKRMRLRVAPGGVELSLPADMGPGTAASVRAFVDQNLRWLDRALADNPDVTLAPLSRQEADPTVPLRGHAVPVVWHEGPVARAEIHGADEDEDEVHAWLPTKATDALARSVLRGFLEAELRKDAAVHLKKWLPTIPGGAIARLSLRPTRDRWGSMSTSKRLVLDLALVGARPSALEYVIVHELCHQIHMNHSPAFWREVARRFPNYKAEEAHLIRIGARLKSMLHRVC